MPDNLETLYDARYQSIEKLAANLCIYIQELISNQPRIDRVVARAKSKDSFLKKAQTLDGGKLKYDEPLHQIQDQIGARIVVFYKSDVDRIDKLINNYFRAIEFRTIIPDSEAEFTYFGRHLVLVLPNDVIESEMDRALVPPFFELQIKTLFQHAWSEADHDLAYKPGDIPLTPDQKRLVAFTSAQAWGADHMFDRLFQERSNGFA